MKSSSVRGTPVRHISNTASEGMMAGKPSGYSGTVNRQFEGDQKGNRQVGVASGTPYNSQDGNSDEFSRTVSQGKYGKVIDPATGDQADPKVNGNGTIFDGVSREEGYLARAERTMDSPVPEGAPHFDTRTIVEENIAHLGVGAVPGRKADDILSIGGVISRGMDGTSHSSGGVEELLEDDVLMNRGRGGAVGAGSAVRHEKE